jgi:hypothetical protein
MAWDFANEKWWHYHDGSQSKFSKGFMPAELV